MANCKRCILCDVYANNSKRIMFKNGAFYLKSNFHHQCDGTEMSIVCRPSETKLVEDIILLSTQHCPLHWPVLYSGFLKKLESEQDRDTGLEATNYFDFQEAAVEHIKTFDL